CPLVGKGPEHIDFVVVRENTEGLYAGTGGLLREGTPDEVAIQTSVNTRMGVERCLRYAFDYCQRRNNQKKLTLCGKTNVLTYAFGLWERVFNTVGAEYPEIKRDYAHVDAICMWMVKNPAPKYTGQNVINPLAAICAGAMMLDVLGEAEAAQIIEEAVKQVCATKLKSLAAGRMGYSTSEVGDLVVAHL
ncbi:MAG: isocitrate/isopropylmalate family dehydrogenase, partial [Desulfomonilaceae bacterium]|nr:isocitrate/isopropylmalate family dehydrogenase [Desulfomonilaceae bacterium]